MPGMLGTYQWSDTPQGRWMDLVAQRNEPGANQAQLGPREHGAYMEHLVAGNPLWAIPALGMIPGYEAAKAMGMLSGRSPPSLDSMAEGYRGMWRGLFQ